ncbi:hypothetical protein NL108_001838 [Boleophthalmus pectinirostris]|nr:hypothetical protein NL108_001838 [Boleophthalmus pectinirostris]
MFSCYHSDMVQTTANTDKKDLSLKIPTLHHMNRRMLRDYFLIYQSAAAKLSIRKYNSLLLRHKSFKCKVGFTSKIILSTQTFTSTVWNNNCFASGVLWSG